MKYSRPFLLEESQEPPDGAESPIDFEGLLLKHNEEMQAEFERIFRRPPEEDEPFFFPTNLLMSAEDVQDSIAAAMQQATIDPALQYAMQKTGWIIGEANRHLFSSENLQEWDDAIVEYREWQSGVGRFSNLRRLEDAIASLEDEFARLPLVLSLFLRHAHAPKRGRTTNRDMAFFYATKTLKSLQACDALVGLNYGEDAMSLGRSIFENYLQILFAIKKPAEHDDWVTAKTGLVAGTHEFPTKNGKVVFRQIREKSSGRTVDLVSRAKMAKEFSPIAEDAQLYELLYEVLSSYAHPDPVQFENYVSSVGFDAAGRSVVAQAHSLACFLTALNLDALVHLGGHPKRARRDGLVLLREIRKKSRPVFRELREVADSALTETLAKRIERIGKPWPKAKT